MGLSRRDVLRAAGATAAAGALAAIGCGGRGAGRAPVAAPADLRAALRDAVARVRARFPAASGWLAIRDRATYVAGSDTRAAAREVTATVVLAARDAGGHRVERIGDAASAAGIVALGAELAALGPGGGRTLTMAVADDHAPRLADDPSAWSGARWLVELDDVLARADAAGSSRIVWRIAHAVVDDERTWFVGDGLDVHQRAVRVRSGVSLLAWNGARPMVGEAVVARAGAPAPLDDTAIARAARGALERLTPGAAPHGETVLVLDGSCVAALVAAGIGEVATTGAWRRPDLAARPRLGQPIGAAAIAIADDPRAGGPGGYVVDDEGWPAARTAIVEGGVLVGVLADEAGAAATGLPRTGHGRRDVRRGAARARPSDLLVSTGAAEDGALIGGVDDGVLVEDADGAVVDPATWRVVVRARRARRIAGGALTGHVWGDVAVRGAVPDLLGAVTAVGATATAYPRDGGGSVAAPAVATRGALAPRRSR